MAKQNKGRFGIAEWYGSLFRAMPDTQRKLFANAKAKEVPCPYFSQVPALAPKAGLHCSKAGGVCSLRNFKDVEADALDEQFGPISATCPNRFLENGHIIRHIAKTILNTDTPLIAKEIPFLRRSDGEAETPEGGTSDKEDVGRIDLVFVHPDEAKASWCAVEMQAVYFSGGEMAPDFSEIRSYSGNGIPIPQKARRPDFRSSGPKRLMPQLQIKVPTLRRWGKKMAVVIDKPFLDAMGKMHRVPDISNCDIVWVIVNFRDNHLGSKVEIEIADTIFTTLEDSVTALTAGTPTTLTDFEARLRKKARPSQGDWPLMPS